MDDSRIKRIWKVMEENDKRLRDALEGETNTETKEHRPSIWDGRETLHCNNCSHVIWLMQMRCKSCGGYHGHKIKPRDSEWQNFDSTTKTWCFDHKQFMSLCDHAPSHVKPEKLNPAR